MADFKFARGQRVRVREGSFPLNNPDGYALIGRTGFVERAWDPPRGEARSAHRSLRAHPVL